MRGVILIADAIVKTARVQNGHNRDKLKTAHIKHYSAETNAANSTKLATLIALHGGTNREYFLAQSDQALMAK